MALYSIAGLIGFGVEVWRTDRASVAAWAFLGSSLLALLIAAVPIAKARLLAKSTSLGAVATGIAQSADAAYEKFYTTDGAP